MKVKKHLLSVFIAILSQGVSFSQNESTCGSSKKEDDLHIDINSITKCAAKDETSSVTSRNAKRVTVQVSARRRIIRRKKSVASSVSSIKATNKLEEIKKNAALVSKLNLDDDDVAEKLPFSFVEEKPAFPKCSDASLNQQAECFKTEILKHIQKHFRYPEKSHAKSIQGRVLIQFVIDEYGDITDIITRGPMEGKELEDEAKRIITKMPKLSPGKMFGKPIKVKYGIPITFKIPGRAPSNVRKKNKENVTLSEVVNFASVEQIPLFKSCKNKDTDDKKLDCFNSQMAKHVKKYFTYPEDASKNNIQGRVYAYFVIDKEGDIVNIKTRGPKNGELLEAATKTLVEKLPKLIPGKHNGKEANVKYAFPINFKLH